MSHSSAPRRAFALLLLAVLLVPRTARAGLFTSKTELLYKAVDAGDLKAVQALVASGADVNGVYKGKYDWDVYPMIITAAGNGSLDVFRFLVEHGAKLDAKGYAGNYPIHIAADKGRIFIVKYLVERPGAGAEQLRLRNGIGDTPLHCAASGGSVAVVDYLLDHGADIETRDDQGKTPLYESAFLHVEGLQELLARGARAEVVANDGTTPLHNAAKWGYPEIVDALLEQGLDPEARDHDGWTPLHYAAAEGSMRAIGALIDRGVDPGLKDKQGRTPAEVACKNRSWNPGSCDKADVLRHLQPVSPTQALQNLLGRGLAHPRPPHDFLWGAGPRLELPENIAKTMGERGFDNVAGLTRISVKSDFEQFVGSAPAAPSLMVQDRYESGADFKTRADAARADFERAQAAYETKRGSYPESRSRAFLEPIFLGVFGRPKVEKTEYDPDGQVFSATVVSDSALAKDFRETFLLKDPVPNAQAASFDKSLQAARVVVRFHESAGTLSIADAVFSVDGATLAALPAQGATAAVARMQVDLSQMSRGSGVAAPDLSIQYADNPELVGKVKELDELRKKRAEQSQISSLQHQIDELSGKSAAAAAPHSDVDDAAAAGPERGDDFALVVGIEGYHEKDLPPASYAERDADAAARHFTALGVPARNLKLLKGSDATLAEVEGNLDWLARNSRPDSRVYFFFSGHGAPDPKSGTAFLMPWDGNPAFLDKSGLPLNRLYDSLGKVHGRVLVVLDSCFSGRGQRSVIQHGTRPLVTVNMPVDALPENVSVMAASKGDEVTGSLDDQGHGLFTYYFLKDLNSGEKDTGALCRTLGPQVADASARQSRTQTPVCMGPSFQLP